MHYKSLLTIAVLTLSACVSKAPSQHLKPAVSVQEAYEMTQKPDVVLFDVREADEVQEQAYVARAVLHIPLSELENRLTEVPKDKVLVMACRSGRRSQQACDILQANGFKHVTNLEGGMLAWEAQGLPVRKANN